jgi:hypothetical protein
MGIRLKATFLALQETIKPKIVEKIRRKNLPLRPKLSFSLGNCRHEPGAPLARFLVLDRARFHRSRWSRHTFD